MNRKVLQQGGVCAICHEEFTDYNDVVPYADVGIMQSIFRSVARLQVRNREENRGSRAGELKMDWTKTPRCRWRYGY